MSVFALIGLAEAGGASPTAVGVRLLTSNDLVNQSFRYDGTRVSYRGEVVGPIMFRGNDAWINVYDGTYAIGLWCPAKDARRIIFSGDYHNRGDVVEVSGTFHRACIEHGGDLDIHCDSLKVVEEGRTVTHPVDRMKVLAAFTLAVIVFALFFDKVREGYKATEVAIRSPIWRIFFRIRGKILPGVMAEISYTAFLMVVAAATCVVVAYLMGWFG